ncbi:unnamed protein product [Ceutorhynchus assimilis]|uniref:endo-polygalacturonase n=1 Tax=Ceutorhynchus assimilis TaxID=467358 RepID=A0A9N9MFE3_9CUCU|nr:unnamed protein product [Ceutorhynchus assimilis]
MFRTLHYILVFSFIIFKQLFADDCLVTKFEQVFDATRNCDDISIVNLTVPSGNTLKLNLTDGARVVFKGKTTFEYSYPWRGPLVTINGTRLTIEGEDGHIFDGQGQYYWDGLGDHGVLKPQFFTVQTFHSVMKNIYVLNSPHDVLQITNSDNVTYFNWFINDTAGNEDVAPKGKYGKNTDAFDIWNSTHVLIHDSVVYNQDDCVAIRCGSDITVHDMECYGTHGLSISVGFSNDSIKDNPLNTLSNVHISNSIVHGGENVIHIKTHNEGGYGIIENVTYENLDVKDVKNYGIFIEQNYPSHGEPLDNVPIKNLKILNIWGNVEPNAIAVSVVCAEDGCDNWHWQNIGLKGSKKNNKCNYKPIGTTVCDN